jgi:hypothetical protein
MLAAAPLAGAIGPVCWNMIVAARGPGFPSVIPFALLFDVTRFAVNRPSPQAPPSWVRATSAAPAR